MFPTLQRRTSSRPSPPSPRPNGRRSRQGIDYRYQVNRVSRQEEATRRCENRVESGEEDGRLRRTGRVSLSAEDRFEDNDDLGPLGGNELGVRLVEAVVLPLGTPDRKRQ